MQDVVDKICETVEENPSSRIIVLTPSEVISKRLVALCAKKKHILLGVYAMTPLGLAREVCAAKLYAKNAPVLLEDGQSEDLILECLKKAAGGKGFFANPHIGERATAVLMQDVISELDENHISNDLLKECSNKERIEALAIIRDSYIKIKRNENYWDKFDLLQNCVNELSVTHDYDDTVFITLNCFSFTGLEQKIIDELEKKGRLITLADNTADTTETDRQQYFFKCRSKEVEVHYILKDILAHNFKVDECAVVYLSNDYADAFLTESELFGIQVSVYGGVSFASNKYYYMYKALQEWKNVKYDSKKRYDGKYSEYAYNAEVLCGLIANKVLPMSNPGDFCRLMREYKAGWGKERYEQILDLAESEAELKKQPTDSFPKWRNSIQLFLAVASEEGTLEEQKQALLGVLKGVNAKDPAAYSIIKKAINSIRCLDEGESALGRLIQILQNTTYRSEVESSGKLLCTPLKQSFFTGRKYLYICGMNRIALQGGHSECPLLLDEEKEILQLKTLVDYEKENEKAVLQLLSEKYYAVKISYNYFDTEKMIELQPAPLFRKLHGDKVVTNIDYLGDGKDLTIGDHIKNKALTVEEITKQPEVDIPQLKKYIEDAVYSASSLETALGCPFKFFMNKVLGLYPYEEPVSNEDSWLESNEIGTLCHDVLEQYYKNGLRPYDEKTLETLLTAAVDRLKKKKPLAKASAMDADIDKARTMAKRAIDWTTENVQEITATELAFGKKDEKEPLKITVAKGVEIAVSGSIDRLEVRKENNVAKTYVLDYKSGKEFDDAKLKIKVQPLVYALAAEALAAKQKKKLRVDGSGYLFLKDEAKELSVPQDDATRDYKKNTISSLISKWLMDAEKIQTRCPAFVLNEDGSIAGTAMEKIDDKAEAEKQIKKAKQDIYCNNCEFSAFCKDVLDEDVEGKE